MNKGRNTLIIGCGYLGRHLLHNLQQQTIIVTSRNTAKLQDFEHAGYLSVFLDVNNSCDEFFQRIKTFDELTVFFLLPPSQIQVTGFENFLNKLKDLSIHKAIMVSSTVVYGSESRVVDADSSVKLDSDRANKQFSLERLWLQTSHQFFAVRLAGIYGTNRVIGAKNLIQEKPITSDPDAWLNVIHVEDAANLLIAIAESDAASNIELGCDNHPVKRLEYYSWLANQLNAPAPLFENNKESRGANRQCSSEVTQQRTGWKPAFKNYQAGVRAALKKTED